MAKWVQKNHYTYYGTVVFCKKLLPKGYIFYPFAVFWGAVHKLPDRFALPLGCGRGMPRPYRAVCPLGRFVGAAAAGGMYAAPTNEP